LLSTRDHEVLLSNAYREHVRNANAQLFEDVDNNDEKNANNVMEIGYTEFDFHFKVKTAGGIENVREIIRRDHETGGKIDQFGYCLAGVVHDEKNPNKEGFESLIARQGGIFRINCLDCLE
jgi:hypothetical protein